MIMHLIIHSAPQFRNQKMKNTWISGEQRFGNTSIIVLKHQNGAFFYLLCIVNYQ